MSDVFESRSRTFCCGFPSHSSQNLRRRLEYRSDSRHPFRYRQRVRPSQSAMLGGVSQVTDTLDRGFEFRYPLTQNSNLSITSVPAIFESDDGAR